MAVIALTSASGSPGVTTTAVGLAFSWPRPVLLVEADPTGGSGILAGYFRGTREYAGGLVELALSPYPVPDALADVVQRIDGTHVSFVAGTRSHTQHTALRELWEPLAHALADLDTTGQDVLLDAGRLGLAGCPDPLLAHADLTLLLSRTTLPALAAARSFADTAARTTAWRDPAVLLVGEGQPYTTGEVAKVLSFPVLAAVADDPDAAAVYSRGAPPPKRFEASPLTRSLRAAAETIRARIATNQTNLLGTPS
jgi:hypothetical protein